MDPQLWLRTHARNEIKEQNSGIYQPEVYLE
jgi:hypothetical protein